MISQIRFDNRKLQNPLPVLQFLLAWDNPGEIKIKCLKNFELYKIRYFNCSVHDREAYFKFEKIIMKTTGMTTVNDLKSGWNLICKSWSSFACTARADWRWQNLLVE